MEAGADSTHTKVTAVDGEGEGDLKYKVGADITAPTTGIADTGYDALTLDAAIECADGDKIVVVESFKWSNSSNKSSNRCSCRRIVTITRLTIK